LREVIAQVIQRDVSNPDVHPLTTVAYVEVTDDLSYAKVYLSVIGSEEEREKTLRAVRSAAGYIGSCASHEVTLRYFPKLSFYLDESVEQLARIDTVLAKIHEEQERRGAQS
jgi:ribosome-binding factor A